VKATIRRPDGTVIELEDATVEDVARLSPPPFAFQPLPAVPSPIPAVPWSPTVPWGPGVICGPGSTLEKTVFAGPLSNATATAVPPAYAMPTAGYPR
jgi:hypothetical protein